MQNAPVSRGVLHQADLHGRYQSAKVQEGTRNVAVAAGLDDPQLARAMSASPVASQALARVIFRLS